MPKDVPLIVIDDLVAAVNRLRNKDSQPYRSTAEYIKDLELVALNCVRNHWQTVECPPPKVPDMYPPYYTGTPFDHGFAPGWVPPDGQWIVTCKSEQSQEFDLT